MRNIQLGLGKRVAATAFATAALVAVAPGIASAHDGGGYGSDGSYGNHDHHAYCQYDRHGDGQDQHRYGGSSSDWKDQHRYGSSSDWQRRHKDCHDWQRDPGSYRHRDSSCHDRCDD